MIEANHALCLVLWWVHGDEALVELRFGFRRMSDSQGLAVRVPVSGFVGPSGWNYMLRRRNECLGLATDVTCLAESVRNAD